jgi:hypothetical protein
MRRACVKARLCGRLGALRPRRARALPAWLFAAALACGRADDAPGTEPAPAPPSDPADPGKVEPAPQSELAFGRAVLEALQKDDWDAYANLLVTRADMLEIHSEEERGVGRERRKRRRMVWRRVNRLRDGEAEEGWSTVRRTALMDAITWSDVRLADVRRHAVEVGDDRDLPTGTTAARLVLVLEHRGTRRALALGTCVRSSRGWVALHPLAWQELGPEPPAGESLLAPGEPRPEPRPEP